MTQETILIQRLKEGDIIAFRETVEQYKDRVLNTCYRFLLNKQDAEDISQEVFLEVFQSIVDFRQQSSLSTWIYRISVTKCLDEIKKRKRKKRISSAGKLLHLDNVAAWLTGGKKADEDLQEKESLRAVMNALDQLPDNQRAAFTLSKIERYNNDEIAAILQVSNMAVESLIYRAKKSVSKQLMHLLKK